MLNFFKRKPSWSAFLHRYPPEWRDSFARISDNHRDSSIKVHPEDRANHKALLRAAVVEVAGEDAAEFISEFNHFAPSMFDPDNKKRKPVLDKIDALSPLERTVYFVNVLRAIKLLRATGMAPPSRPKQAWTKEWVERNNELPDLKYLHINLADYPLTLNCCPGGGIAHINPISYAAVEIAKGRMIVEEGLAIEFLRLMRVPRGGHLLFAKGLAKHLVAPYRATPSPEYLLQFDETRAFLNAGVRGFGRQNAWSDFKHYLRQLMNTAAKKPPGGGADHP